MGSPMAGVKAEVMNQPESVSGLTYMRTFDRGKNGR